MTRAPETPTTEELHQAHPLSMQAQLAVVKMRGIVAEAINNPDTNTLGIVGYCARPGAAQADEIMRESHLVHESSNPSNGLVTLHRGPMWKPRTNPEDWHGEETTDPDGAFRTIRDQAELHANVAVEIGHAYQLRRYGHMLSFIWTGGRSIEDDELIKAAAVQDPTIPLGVKNGLDGTIDRALEQIEMVTELRGKGGAPVTLIYRGGSKATSPEAWAEAVMDVHEATQGRYILDTAHGTEMAHDPQRKFGKSVDGQILAVYAMHRLARQGYVPGGTMMEASGLNSPTDPHMPLEIALDGVKQQHAYKVQHIPSRLQAAYP